MKTTDHTLFALGAFTANVSPHAVADLVEVEPTTVERWKWTSQRPKTGTPAATVFYRLRDLGQLVAGDVDARIVVFAVGLGMSDPSRIARVYGLRLNVVRAKLTALVAAGWLDSRGGRYSVRWSR